MRDIATQISVAHSLAPATRTAGASGAGVDLAEWNAAAVIVHVGAYTDGTHTIEIQEADDDGTGSPATWAAVADTELDGTEPIIDASADANSVFEIGYKGSKRHLRVVVTTSGTTSGATYGASILRGHPQRPRA